jgi:hypothetical protein
MTPCMRSHSGQNLAPDHLYLTVHLDQSYQLQDCLFFAATNEDPEKSPTAEDISVVEGEA